MTQAETKRTTVDLPPDLHKAIKGEAVDNDRNMNDIMVEQLAARYPGRSFFSPGPETKLHITSETKRRNRKSQVAQ
jgi:hypothetical protein